VVSQLPDWRPDGKLPSMETPASSWPFGEFVACVMDRESGQQTWVRYRDTDDD
jgi:hypothetical protein